MVTNHLQVRESPQVKDQRSSTELHHQPISREWNVLETSKLTTPPAIMHTSFQVIGQGHQVDKCSDRKCVISAKQKGLWTRNLVQRHSTKTHIIDKCHNFLGKRSKSQVTWSVWQVLAHKSSTKVTETPKLVVRLPTRRAIMHTSFKVKRSRSPGQLLLRPKVYYIYRTGRRTNVKIGKPICSMHYQLPRPAIKAREVGVLACWRGILCRPHAVAPELVFYCTTVICPWLSVNPLSFVLSVIWATVVWIKWMNGLTHNPSTWPHLNSEVGLEEGKY